MLIVWVGIVFTLLFLIAIVDFVLVNETMFKAPFDIIFRVPFSEWKYTFEDVQFIYLITGSVLLGALIIALSTFVLDAKRKLKMLKMKKELKALQKTLEETKAALPEEDTQEQTVEDGMTPSETADEASATPEDITKSFEDTVEGGDFLRQSTEESPQDTRQDTVEEQDEESETDKQLPQATAVEAELVGEEDESSLQEESPAKKDKEFPESS